MSTAYVDLIKNLSRASISIFILLYPLSFLKIERSSYWFKFVLVFIAARIVYAAFVLEHTTVITFHFELFAILISTVLSIKSYFEKDGDARYMMVGFSFMSFSYFIFYLSVVWDSKLGGIGFVIMYFGLAAETIFTTLALTERFKRIEIENFQKDQRSKKLEHAVNEGAELITIQNNILEEQSVELNTFLYGASHDLSGPIKSIEGLVNLAEIDPVADLPKLYKMIREKLATLENNVSDLKSISLLRNKGKNLREIDFAKIHEEVANYFAPLLVKHTVSISFTMDIKTAFHDDYYIIKKVCRHLFENAIKFKDINKRSFLKITVAGKGNKIHLTFEDNGIGIEEFKMPMIFKMFFRGAENTRNDTGLGLYIVQLTVKKLNGEIAVESVFGKGTTFRIEFPI